MDIRHFKLIKEVNTYGNLTKAAEHLYLSQSALSHQLKEIESFFNTQVFIRQKNKMILTKAGEVILLASKNILKEIEATKNKVKYLDEEDAGEIRISTECYTSYHWLSSFLKEFKLQFPRVEIFINAEATYNSVDYLLKNKIDIGIFGNSSNKKLNYTPLFKDEFVAIMAPDHPLAKMKWVTPQDLLKENYLMYAIPEEQSTLYQLFFKQAPPRKVTKIALTEAIIEMVKAGIGVAVLANWSVKPFIESGQIIAKPVTKNKLKRIWYAGTLKDKIIPPYMHSFMKNLSKHLKQSAEFN